MRILTFRFCTAFWHFLRHSDHHSQCLGMRMKTFTLKSLLEAHSLSALDANCFCWWERRTRWTTSGGMGKILETSILFTTPRKTTLYSRLQTRGLLIIIEFINFESLTCFFLRLNLHRSPLSKVLIYPKMSLMFIPRRSFFSLDRGIISFNHNILKQFSFRIS